MNRAAVCTKFTGEDAIEVRDWEPSAIGNEGVRIAVHAAGLNYPDCLAIRGEYQVRSEPPFVPGSECAGVVTEVGSGATRFTPGDRVVALPAVGAFATDVVVQPPMPIHHIPDSMPFDDAAAFVMTYGTAYHGLIRRGQLVAGETVVVLGASGGTGSAAVQVAKAAGAQVIAVAGGPEKCAMVRKLGADVVLDHREIESLSQAVRAATGGRGADVMFDPVGGVDIREQLRALAWSGRYLIVGFAGGGIPKVGLNHALLKGISLVGVAFGADAFQNPDRHIEDFHHLLRWYESGWVRPQISERYALEDIADGLRSVRGRTVIGKIVVDLS